MSKEKSTVTFLFRNFSQHDLLRAGRGLLPKDYFYFYHFLRKYFSVRALSLPSSPFTRAVNILNDFILRILFQFDIPLLLLFLRLPKFRRINIIFATTPKLGIGLALLKKLGLVKSKLIINICGLYDQLKQTSFPGTRILIRFLFSEVDLFISGASLHETIVLREFLNLPAGKFHFVLYSGIDIGYFSPAKNRPEDFILGIGVDPARDWQLYRKVASALPNETFVWATMPKLIPFPIPTNVNVRYFTTNDLREQMRSAKLVLILTRQNHHFSGQASAMRAMSCGKAVILTKTPGVEEFPLKHLHNCVLIEPGNATQVITYIKKLSRTPHLAQQIGDNAARMIRRSFRNDQIGKEYVKLFQRLLFCYTSRTPGHPNNRV